MGNPTTPGSVPAHCQAVNWCSVGKLQNPHGAYHVGDLGSLSYGAFDVAIELWRPVEETDPAKTMVRIAYSEFNEEQHCFDVTPDIAFGLAEVIRTMPLQTAPDFVAALRDGRRKLERERPR